MIGRTSVYLCLSGLLAGSVSASGIENRVQDAQTPFKLVGTVVSADPDRSVAVFQADRSGEPVILGVGETLSGFTLINVQKAKVIFVREAVLYEIYMNAGGPVRLDLEDRSGSAVPDESEEERVPDPAGGDTGPPREFDRAAIRQKLQADWARIMKEAQIVPQTREGLIVGFKLVRFPEGSLLEDVGLKPGDILMEVNGVVLDSVATALSLYQTLQSADRIRVTVLRDGRTIALRYVLH